MTEMFTEDNVFRIALKAFCLMTEIEQRDVLEHFALSATLAGAGSGWSVQRAFDDAVTTESRNIRARQGHT